MNKKLNNFIANEYPEFAPLIAEREFRDEISELNSTIEQNLEKLSTTAKTPLGVTMSIKGDKLTTIKGKDGVDGKDGKDGEKGERGDDGKTPVKGVDYFDGEPGEQGPPGKTGPKGPKGDKGDKGEPGKDGKDGRSIDPEEVISKINTSKSLIKKEKIDGLPTVTDVIKELKDPSSKNRLEIQDIRNWNQPNRGKIDQRWHGGGDTVVAGSNITVTTNDLGQKVIASTGGGAVDSVNGETGVVVLTTGDIAEDVDANYVSDAQLTVLSNTSGVNTGDQTISDATISTSDITTNNASTTKHGFLKKLSNVSTEFMNGQGNWATPASAVSLSAYDYIVYKSGANTVAYKTSDGTTLSTNSDASVVLQACVDQMDASTGTGGSIYVMSGTYSMATVVTIQGDQTANSPMVKLHGNGTQSTIFKPSVNVTAFTVSNRAKVSLKDFAIIVRGSGDGISSTNSSLGQRAFWQSEFKNIYIYDDGSSTLHSGWGMNLGNPFRSVFENIEMNQVKNGMKLEALDTSTNYNPGDLTVTRMFIELQSGASSGVGIHLSSPSTGDMNQMVFNMVELIGTGTGQTGILLDGASGTVNHTNWTGINVEEFATILDIETGRNNYFDFNYIITIDAASTTYFKTTTSAYNNYITAKYIDTYTQSVTIVNDAQTSLVQPNTFDMFVLQGSATTTTFTTTAATRIGDIRDNALGTSARNHTVVTVGTTASSATPTPDCTADMYTVTALAAAATFGAPTGTPKNGQELIIRVKDNGTARALGFNAIYRFSSDLAAPTTTVINKTIYMKFIYNSADTKWDCLAWLSNF